MRPAAKIHCMDIKVSIVEDDSRICGDLSKLINGAENIRCISTYSNAETALTEIPRLKPDVVLMDINLPGMTGIECTRALRVAAPSVRIVMLTVYDEVGQLFKSLMAGACGYLLKRTTREKLLEAIAEAHLGGAPMTPKIARKVVQYFQELGEAAPESPILSKREQETLALLAEGFRYKEIADKLGISFNTVRQYAHSLYAKLHVTSRTEAAMKYQNQQSLSARMRIPQ